MTHCTRASICSEARKNVAGLYPRLPCLYIFTVANVLERAPLIPCFIGGSRYPMIPHSFGDDRRLGDASADTQRDRGNGSRLY